MARGWESKSVEDQIGAAEEERASRRKPQVSVAQREHQSKRAGLLLSRAKVLKDLEAAGDARYRELLERSLAHLEAELAGAEEESRGG